MSHQVNIQSAVTVYPSSVTGQTNVSASTSQYPLSNGYNGTSNTSNYARIQLTASNTTTDCYIYYKFNVDNIPSNATINSVQCQARIYRNNRTSGGTSTYVQLYSNNTAKGSVKSGITTSSAIHEISNTGSWTVSELSNARLRINGRRSATNQSSYLYFYGANLVINYTVQGVEYEITSTLSTDAVDSIEPPGLTNVSSGGSYELRIDASDISNIRVVDNGVDVTSSLTEHVSQVIQGTFSGVPSSYDSVNSKTPGFNSGYGSANGLTDADSTTRATFSSYTQANSETCVYYNFDCSSIPENAIIDSIDCEFKATISSAYFATRIAQLCCGTTKKGSPTTVTNYSTQNTVYKQTMSDCGTWTRSELDDIKILIQAIRGTSTNNFNPSFFGATLNISYHIPITNPYYWTYSLTNINDDHTIIIEDAVIEIPDEDPQYEYYPITISSINATTTPGRGTTRVVEGTNETITIYPSDPLVTLITDNGVDVSNQLVAHNAGSPSYTVSTAQGASYGFVYSSNTGYYTSNNKGVNKSAAVCRVDFDLPVRCLVTISFINYAEATYDFGVFGNIDTTLSNSYYAAGSGGATITDSSYKLACNTSTYNSSSVKTITYEIEEGQHFIYIKYSKDDGTSSNNDTLQWKIDSIQELESNNIYYTYTLSNIQSAHSLIFIFGDVTYYFVNSSGTNARLYPDGSFVELPGDSYRLTIVPDDYSYGISITDNNSDVTSSLETIEQEITKDGETYTVINYIYNISNVQAAHNIIVVCTPQSGSYVKMNNEWVYITKCYLKVNNVWTEVSDINEIITSGNIYINGITSLAPIE